MSKNSQLSKLMSDIKDKYKAAKNNDDLLDAVSLAKEYDGPLIYDNTLMYVASFILLLADIFLWFQIKDIRYWDISHILGFSFLTISILIPIIIAYSRKSSTTDLSQNIFNKDALLDNNIHAISLKDKLIASLPSLFVEFDRGNSSREFRQAWKKEAEHSRLSKEYFLYQFHYVDSRTEVTTTTNANGTTSVSTRTVYDHYDRYGLVFDFSHIKNFHICSSGKMRNKVDYNSSSISFSNEYSIGADNEMNASKYLKPKIVTLIEELSNSFTDINLEFNDSGLLCISFKDDNVFYAARNFGLRDPDEFYKELSGHTELTKLDTLVDFLKELSRHSDNNFQEK